MLTGRGQHEKEGITPHRPWPAGLGVPAARGADEGGRGDRATHRLQPGLQAVGVLAARHALHEDVADVAQDGARCQQHQPRKDEGADGVHDRPARVALRGHTLQ